MADLNKVFLIGRLTQDPELRYTPGGAPVTDLRLATSRILSGGDEGERREETLYIDVTVWNRQAENCCQYLTKGSAVHIEGFLRMDSWEDKTSGEKRSKVKVVADRVQFLDPKGRREEGSSHREEDALPRGGSPDRRPNEYRSAPAPRPASAAPAARRPVREPEPPEAEDDIPF